MSGIVFFATERRDAVVEFYREHLDAEIWLSQTDCTVLDRGGFRFGFCSRESAETCGILTFVEDSREGVDAVYGRLGAHAEGEPTEVERYGIYRFFANDPEGRTVEVQRFL
ncbi:VOC family protein [Natronorarus salvus]|uniref:VOC family protein n=1 Tax=Natronorarus salvus TaxID=3117733 RepID=UPI002F26C82B